MVSFIHTSFKICFFLIILFNFSLAALNTDISRLRSDLLRGYDKNARPIQNQNNATSVQVYIYIRGFDMDERKSVFSLYSWTILRWRDDHLKWDPKMYGNITVIHFASQEVWQPDLAPYNNLEQSEIDHFKNTRVVGSSSGWLVWVPPTKFSVGCYTNLRKWPYDTQRCEIVLGSWAHDGSQLQLSIPPNKTDIAADHIVENREWEMTDNRIEVRLWNYGTDMTYPDIYMSFTLKRRSSTHSAAIVIPALAISVTILIGFWLTPAATERLALILIVTIVNAIYLNKIYIAIPNNGDNVPLVLLYYRDSLIMVVLDLIWTVGLRYLALSKRTSPVPLPSIITTFLSSWPAKFLCLDPRPGRAGEDGPSDDDGNKLVGNKSPYQADWAWLAHLLDRFAFVIYFIVYLCFTFALLY